MTSNINDNINMEQLLRSINIIYDADQPQRISHFRPTSKAVVLLESLMGSKGDKAFFISAPYGSGKSLTATYLLQLIENCSSGHKVLSEIGKRITDISPKFSKNLKTRISKKQKGLVVALQGYQKNLPNSFKKALYKSARRIGLDIESLLGAVDFNSVEDISKALALLSSKSKSLKIDKVVILWDEFGRHIESLISEGHPEELNQLQSLAEYVSRIQKIDVTLGLILHQSLLNYAGKTPQNVKREWKKIEGRFNTIQYVDTSKEIYQLIAKVIASLKNNDENSVKSSTIEAITKEITDYKIFEDFTSSERNELFKQASPLNPVALYLLPRIASRIAQHERTLFTFLNSVDINNPISLSNVYDYFSMAMSGDTNIGGTYHQWLESQSAISKTDNADEINILKSACLLGIGLSGERQRISKAYLTFAISGYELSKKKVQSTIGALIRKKLLLYRKNSDSVSLWHGTDIDLLGKLKDEKEKQSLSFDAISFLRTAIAPPLLETC